MNFIQVKIKALGDCELPKTHYCRQESHQRRLSSCLWVGLPECSTLDAGAAPDSLHVCPHPPLLSLLHHADNIQGYGADMADIFFIIQQLRPVEQFINF